MKLREGEVTIQMAARNEEKQDPGSKINIL